MKSNLIKTTSIYAISDMIALFVSTFVIIPLLTKTLPGESYSVYSLCINASSLFSFLFLFGIPSTVGLLYSEYKEKKVDFITTALVFQFIFSLLLLIILFFVKYDVWNTIAPKIDVYFYFYITLFIAFFSFSQNLLAVIYRYENQASKFLILQSITTIINLFFILIYLLSNNKSDKNALIIVLGTNIGVSLYSFIILFKSYFSFKRFNKEILKNLLYCCVPFLVSYILYFLSNKIFLVFIQKYSTQSSVGIFYLLFQYVGLLTIISNTLMKVFSPTLYQYNKDSVWIDKVRIINCFLSSFYLLCVLGLYLLGKIIITVFSNTEYYNQEVLFFLLLGGYAYVLSSVPNQIMLSYKAFKFSNGISFITAGFTVLFSFLFIKDYGITGAARTYCFVQISMVLLSYIIASVKLKKLLIPSIDSLILIFLFLIFYFLNLPLVMIFEIVILIWVLYKQYKKLSGSF